MCSETWFAARREWGSRGKSGRLGGQQAAYVAAVRMGPPTQPSCARPEITTQSKVAQRSPGTAMLRVHLHPYYAQPHTRVPALTLFLCSCARICLSAPSCPTCTHTHTGQGDGIEVVFRLQHMHNLNWRENAEAPCTLSRFSLVEVHMTSPLHMNITHDITHLVAEVEPRLEVFQRGEHLRQQEVEQAPQLGEVVLQRGACRGWGQGQRTPLSAHQVPYTLRILPSCQPCLQ